jgi:RNA polymerase sigma-70 factor (ECF subfamily)
MNDAERAALDLEIRAHQERGDHDGAAEIALAAYGREIKSFLVALHARDEDGADETFSLFAVGVWRGLPGFAWHCSFRTWAYAVARRCSLRQRRDARRRAARHDPLPEGSALSNLVAKIQRETHSSVTAERRSHLLALREALPPEDQTLLMLRVDRELSWNDLAQVLHDDDAAPLSGKDLEREAARLRKRFQTIKSTLRAAAAQVGLIDNGGDPPSPAAKTRD